MLKLFCSLKHSLALTLNNHKVNLVSHFSSNTGSIVRKKGRKKEGRKEGGEKRQMRGKKKGRKEESKTFYIIINQNAIISMY